MDDALAQLFEAYGSRDHKTNFHLRPPPPLQTDVVLDYDGDLWLEVGGSLHNGNGGAAEGDIDSDGGNNDSDGGNDDSDGGNDDSDSSNYDSDSSNYDSDSDDNSDSECIYDTMHLLESKRLRTKGLAQRRQSEYRFKVCSRTMRRGSPVWRAMLFGPWLERKPGNGEDWVVALPDDSPVAMAVVLLLVHGRLDLMPTWRKHWPNRTLTAISLILSAADKYDTIHLFRPFAQDWLQYARLSPLIQLNDSQRTTYQLNMAWQLGATEEVSNTLRYLVYQKPKKYLRDMVAVAEDGPRVGISLSFRDALDTAAACQQAAIQDALDFLSELVEDLKSVQPMGYHYIKMGWHAVGCRTVMFREPCMMDRKLEVVQRFRKAMFGGPYELVPKLEAAQRFKKSNIISGLQEHFALQRHHCNDLVLKSISKRLDRAWGHGTGSPFPGRADDIHMDVNSLMDIIRHIVGVPADYWDEPEAAALTGHDRCREVVRDRFRYFDRALHASYRLEKKNSEQVDRLQKRGDMLLIKNDYLL